MRVLVHWDTGWYPDVQLLSHCDEKEQQEHHYDDDLACKHAESDVLFTGISLCHRSCLDRHSLISRESRVVMQSRSRSRKWDMVFD